MSATAVSPPRFRRTDVVLTALAIGVNGVVLLADHHAGDLSPTVLALFAAVAWLPLLVRHRWPLAVLGVVVLVECIHLATVPLLPPVQFNSAPAVVMLAAYEVGVRRPWRTAWLASGAAALTILGVGVMTRDLFAADMFALDLVLGATGAGVLVRSRHHRLLAMEQRALEAERTRGAEARRQVAAERLRMARDLHDVVAHHLALVNAQAGVAEYLLRTDTEAAAQALRGIATHSRGALDELRATVGLLRQADGPTDGEADDDLRPVPGLAALDALLDAHRSTGGQVNVVTRGEPDDLPVMNDLTAYRIVQEALTNARKHAPGSPVLIELAWTPAQLEMTVTNDPPPGGPSRPGPGTGHGLVGMRERAAAVGGRLSAAPLPDGAFVVRAVIPSAGVPTDREATLS